MQSQSLILRTMGSSSASSGQNVSINVRDSFSCIQCKANCIHISHSVMRLSSSAWTRVRVLGEDRTCPDLAQVDYNIHIITDSKSAINIVQNYPTWPLSKQRKVVARSTVLRIQAILFLQILLRL